MSGTTTNLTYNKDEVLKNIASATTAEQLVKTIYSVDRINDQTVFEAFFDKLKSITSQTIDPVGLGLLKKKLVQDNFSHTLCEYDDKIRKVILLQIIATATDINELSEIKIEVDDIEDDEVTNAFEEKLASLS